MYWYLEERGERPRAKVSKIMRMKEEYICPECGSSLERMKIVSGTDSHIGMVCEGCSREYQMRGLKTRFDKLSDKERLGIAKEMDSWNRARGRNFYEPNEKEYWWFLQPHKIRGISGGNRAGKTATTIMDMVMFCEGWHPLQKENLLKISKDGLREDVRRHCQRLLNEGLWIKSPPVSCRVVAVDFPNYVDKIIGPEFEKWATQPELKNVSYDNEKKRNILWHNYSRVEMMTTEQKLKAHGGSARDLILFDEEPGEDYWEENKMRIISTNGRMTIGATAIDGVTWTEHKIWKPAELGHPDIYMVEMSTYDNPMNTASVVEKIKNQCRDETEVDIRIFGKRTLRGGHVYKAYREAFPWVIEPFRIPKDRGMIVMAIDTHQSVPHAVLWIWVDYDGGIELEDGKKTFELINGKPNLYEVASLFENGTIPHLVKLIRREEEKNPYLAGRAHEYCILEQAAWNSDQTKAIEKPVAGQFVEQGIFPVRGSKDLKGGLLKVSELLDLPDSAGHPRLMTFKYPEQEYLLFEKRNYHLPDPRKALKLGKTQGQKPVDKDDHLMEDERRIVEFVWDFETNPVDYEDRLPQLMSGGNVVEIDWSQDEDDYDSALG